MSLKCVLCGGKAVHKSCKHQKLLCKECFCYIFEEEVHYTIQHNKLFSPGEKVAIAVSGGKDSTVLAHVLKTLNERYNYGLDLCLLAIDEGIAGYRDGSLESVEQNRVDYDLPLEILSYKDLFGWTMDEVVKATNTHNNCTYCGVFRRQALDKGAIKINAVKIATGHNADDIAETVLMNIFRGDLPRLARCTSITTGDSVLSRCKPLKYAYESEIVKYALFNKLVYFVTECPYSPHGFRGPMKDFIKSLIRDRPLCVLDIIYFGETVNVDVGVSMRTCQECGHLSSNDRCKSCLMLEGLNGQGFLSNCGNCDGAHCGDVLHMF